MNTFFRLIQFNKKLEDKRLKLISWNVNGLRACLNKGWQDFFNDVDADVFCLQEIKCLEGQAPVDVTGYYQYWNSADKLGYSGTVVFTKQEPISVTYGMGINKHDREGRIITCEFESVYFVCCYTPNVKRDLTRLDYRQVWEDDLRNYLMELDKKKPVIYTGDLNVAHQEIDIKNAKSNKGNAGFTDEERAKFTELLESGFSDSFRAMYPHKTDAYTWWSYMGQSRAKNIGWRIDYFIVSNRLMEQVKDATIYPEVLGSDHCPVGLELK